MRKSTHEKCGKHTSRGYKSEAYGLVSTAIFGVILLLRANGHCRSKDTCRRHRPIARASGPPPQYAGDIGVCPSTSTKLLAPSCQRAAGLAYRPLARALRDPLD